MSLRRPDHDDPRTTILDKILAEEDAAAQEETGGYYADIIASS